MKHLTWILLLFFALYGCGKERNSDKNEAVSSSDSITSVKPWVILLDTTIEGKRYGIISPNDTINNTLFFIYDNDKIFQLDAEKLGFHQGIYKWFFECPVITNVYNSTNNTFGEEKIIVEPNYFLFTLSNSGGIFEYICVLFKDSTTIKNCYIIPSVPSKLVDFSGYKRCMMWCSYFDRNNEILVTEERLAYYNTGPYLVSVLKIEKDTIISIGENINNHENYKRFKKREDPNPFVWMMKDYAGKAK